MRTPLALETADRVKAPHVGIDLKNDPKKFAKPRAIISCDASTIFPVALESNEKLSESNFYTITIFFVIRGSVRISLKIGQSYLLSFRL